MIVKGNDMRGVDRKVIESFGDIHAGKPDVVAVAPGRVNVIGEHTDYNDGFVLPVAIDREVVFAAGKAPGNKITGYSIDFDGKATIEAGVYNPGHPCGWLRYVMGVLSELEKTGISVEGFSFTVGGDVPIGAGLSSSAALEMAVCTAMEELFGFRLDDREAALLCQRAENNFVGMNCGIMDQYIARVGKHDHAVLIDCRDLTVSAVGINTPGYSWLVIDSKKRRGLVDSEYNRRRRECEEGVRVAQSVFPERTVERLRDITVADLNSLKNASDDTAFRRAKHVVTENDRVLKTVDALRTGDIDAVGRNLSASHDSLRDDFEVSCGELDMLVGILSEVDGVAGARLTGAGFGGCVIALVRDDAITDARRALEEKYHPGSLSDGEGADIWPITISEGAHILRES